MLNALRRKGEWRGDVPSVLVAFSAVGWQQEALFLFVIVSKQYICRALTTLH